MSMHISDSSYKAAISFFEWINPSIEREVITWKKGMPIELNKIYKHVDSFHYPIAIWSDFENMSKVRIERIFKRIDLIPHEFFLYHNNNRYRVGWKVKNTII